MQNHDQLPYYIKKAVDLDLLGLQDGKINSVNDTAINGIKVHPIRSMSFPVDHTQ